MINARKAKKAAAEIMPRKMERGTNENVGYGRRSQPPTKLEPQNNRHLLLPSSINVLPLHPNLYRHCLFGKIEGLCGREKERERVSERRAQKLSLA